jgi:hypothetical protein
MGIGKTTGYQTKRLHPQVFFVAAKPSPEEGYVFLNDGLPMRSLREAQRVWKELPARCDPLILAGYRPNKNDVPRLAHRGK